MNLANLSNYPDKEPWQDLTKETISPRIKADKIQACFADERIASLLDDSHSSSRMHDQCEKADPFHKFCCSTDDILLDYSCSSMYDDEQWVSVVELRGVPL